MGGFFGNGSLWIWFHAKPQRKRHKSLRIFASFVQNLASLREMFQTDPLRLKAMAKGIRQFFLSSCLLSARKFVSLLLIFTAWRKLFIPGWSDGYWPQVFFSCCCYHYYVLFFILFLCRPVKRMCWEHFGWVSAMMPGWFVFSLLLFSWPD